jgi:hypothetical protein
MSESGAHRLCISTTLLSRSKRGIAIMFSIRPLPSNFLHRVRFEGIDDLGQAVEHHIATGGEPCRDVLRRALPGEQLLLASYCPFTISGPYKEYGPVFVLAEASTEGINYDALPLKGTPAYLAESFVLRAYSSQERIVDAKLSTPDTAVADISAFFTRPDVAFILARFPTYGCFACRIDRT